MMGYMGDADRSADAIGDGWLHSGDMGTVDDRGRLRVTGRIKELIIGAGGENVAPVPIEEQVKALCPALSQAVVVGDHQKYLVMLATLKRGADGRMCDEAAGAVAGGKETLARVLAGAEAPEEHPAVRQHVQAGVDRYNRDHAVSERPKGAEVPHMRRRLLRRTPASSRPLRSCAAERCSADAQEP